VGIEHDIEFNHVALLEGLFPQFTGLHAQGGDRYPP
jgi:hypothetical protein